MDTLILIEKLSNLFTIFYYYCYCFMFIYLCIHWLCMFDEAHVPQSILSSHHVASRIELSG